MQVVVQGLQVEEHEVRHRDDALHGLRWSVSARIDGAVESAVARKLQHRSREFGLEHRLAAGERDATAGTLVEHLVPPGKLDGLPGRCLAPGDLKRSCGTSLDTDAAPHARVAVVLVRIPFDPVPVVFARLDTLRAEQALRREIPDVAPGLHRLRIVTPETPQRTALEEDRRTDAGSVVYREALDIEDAPRHGFQVGDGARVGGCGHRDACAPA